VRFPKDAEIKYIERCIALSSHTVEIKDRTVYGDGDVFYDSSTSLFIDTQVYTKDYTDPGIYPRFAVNQDNYGPVTVPQNHCFKRGDNRDNSFDSRYWGFVPFESVVAKPVYIYWSREKNRIGTSIE